MNILFLNLLVNKSREGIEFQMSICFKLVYGEHEKMCPRQRISKPADCAWITWVQGVDVGIIMLFFIYSTVQINLPFFVSLEGNLLMISPSCLANAWSLRSLMARILQYSYWGYCSSVGTSLLCGQGRETVLTDRGNCVKLTSLSAFILRHNGHVSDSQVLRRQFSVQTVFGNANGPLADSQ